MSRVLDFEKPIVELEDKLNEMRELSESSDMDMADEIKELEEKLEQKVKDIYKDLSRWQRVKLARHPERPYSLDYINMMTSNFMELHGDRYYSDDKSIIAGLATIEDENMVIIGQQKGRNTQQNIKRNFGMPRPEGYRKALRIMKLAEKFNKPVVTLIDTPGAYPGIGAEERGQAEAIAKNLFEMARLKTPLVVIVIGEGASGGAIGIGLGDRILLLENTWYSVISPEGCASILYRDSDEYSKARAAEAMQVTAEDVKDLGIADQILPEPRGGAHRAPEKMAEVLKKNILEQVKELKSISADKLVEDRIEKFSNMGEWEE